MRKLASIRIISDVKGIEGADRIQAYKVDDWWVVDQKDAYQVGDKIVYCEIDSWIPHDVAPFLSKGSQPKEYQGIKGNRLKTIRLKGQLSQGLLLPMTKIPDRMNVPREFWLGDQFIGHDVAELFGIIKWEAPIHASLGGVVRSTYPSWCPKTDQERCQNMMKDIQKSYSDGELFEVTIKLDGSSMSVGVSPDGDYVVCSRNQSLLTDQEGNAFVNTSKSLNIEEKIKTDKFKQRFHKGFMIQGELVGEGIQGNKENIKGHKFFVFDIYDVAEQAYLNPSERMTLVQELELDHVPVLNSWTRLDSLSLYSVDDFLAYAEGTSYNQSTQREGVVFKSCDRNFSFKVISNKWLLKNE